MDKITHEMRLMHWIPIVRECRSGMITKGSGTTRTNVETHALGLPSYELTAIVLKYGKDNFQKPVSEKINYYYNRLLYWKENTDKLGLDWADFLLDDTRPNK